MPEGAPEPFQESGKYVVILQKQPDGSWLVVVDIWNSDLPLTEEGTETET
jgi:ketosteroid isomerase-like protein